MVLAFPPDEDVALGGNEFERIAEPASHGDVHHRHGRAGSAERFGDGLARHGDHAVDEGDAGIVEGEAVRGGPVVLDAEVLLEHLQEHLGPEAGLAVPIVVGVAGIGHAVEVPFGLELHSRGPLVESGQGMADVQILRTPKPGGAEQVHLGDVRVLELLRRYLQQFVEALGLAGGPDGVAEGRGRDARRGGAAVGEEDQVGRDRQAAHQHHGQGEGEQLPSAFRLDRLRRSSRRP